MKLGLRDRKRRRTHELKITLHPEEYEAIFRAANYSGDFAAVWARDVLIGRALRLERQRTLAD